MGKEVEFNIMEKVFTEAGYDLKTDGRAAELCEKCNNILEMVSSPNDPILFAAEMCYYAVNPTTKMDVPSVVYEQMEVKYKQWKNEQNSKV